MPRRSRQAGCPCCPGGDQDKPDTTAKLEKQVAALTAGMSKQNAALMGQIQANAPQEESFTSQALDALVDVGTAATGALAATYAKPYVDKGVNIVGDKLFGGDDGDDGDDRRRQVVSNKEWYSANWNKVSNFNTLAYGQSIGDQYAAALTVLMAIELDKRDQYGNKLYDSASAAHQKDARNKVQNKIGNLRAVVLSTAPGAAPATASHQIQSTYDARNLEAKGQFVTDAQSPVQLGTVGLAYISLLAYLAVGNP